MGRARRAAREIRISLWRAWPGRTGQGRTGPGQTRPRPRQLTPPAKSHGFTDKVGTEEESMGHGADCRAAVNTRCWFPPLRPLPLG